MRKPILAALVLLATFASARLHAQQAQPASQPALPRLIWTFDPIHGVMQATPAGPTPAGVIVDPPVVNNPAPTTTPQTYTGLANITLTINLISTPPSGAALRCSGTLTLQYFSQVELGSPNAGTTLLENTLLSSTESVDAAVKAKSAICKYSIPYSWTVPEVTTSTGTATTQVLISAGVGFAVDQLDTSGAVVRTFRSTSLTLPGPSTIPADGSTITITGSTVL